MRLSKNFYVWGWLGGLVLSVLMVTAGAVRLVQDANIPVRNQMDLALRYRGIGLMVQAVFPMIFASIVFLVLLYKMWKPIQDGQARATPGKALGFLFIPLFNVYWAFQVTWGYAVDYNRYIARHSINVPKLPEGLFLAYPILAFLGFLPPVIIAALVVGTMMIARICDGVNALADAAERKGMAAGAT